MRTRLFLSAAVLLALSAIASAQTVQDGQQVPVAGKGRTAGNVWVDANNDGVCDNFENGTRPGRRAYSAGKNQAAANRGPGRGEGLAQGPRNGQGRHQGLAQGQRNGHPRGRGMMAGGGAGRKQGTPRGKGLHNGQGPAFVDANKDGVCDNLAAVSEKK